MKLRRLLPPALLGATFAGCVNLDLTDPNEPSSDTFWQTPAQAVAGVNAVYNALENNGTYGRWLVFATDLRSDIGMILSPWTDLSNFTKFTFTSYDFEVNQALWQDLTDARAALPRSYSGADVGRATWGAATALLGKAEMQQGKWSAAAATLQEVIASGLYDLMPNYADNFTDRFENNKESLFEVQFGDRSFLSSGVRGLNISRMVGPCGPSYCDGRPTRWYFQQFQLDTTVGGQPDPRLDYTLYYKGGTGVYTVPNSQYFADDTTTHNIREDTLIYFKKYGEYYL